MWYGFAGRAMRCALALALGVACRAPLAIRAVDPGLVLPGETFSVGGTGYAEGLVASLKDEDGSLVALPAVTVASPVRLEIGVPEDLAPGRYELVVERDGQVATLADSLVVMAVRSETPCSPDYTANTEISLVRAEVVVDRFYRNGDRETLRVGLDEVDRLEVERLNLPDGATCSAIFLRTREGRRIVFQDDTAVDLESRAKRLGRDMGKPVEVTRSDEPRPTTGPEAGAATVDAAGASER